MTNCLCLLVAFETTEKAEAEKELISQVTLFNLCLLFFCALFSRQTIGLIESTTEMENENEIKIKKSDLRWFIVVA